MKPKSNAQTSRAGDTKTDHNMVTTYTGTNSFALHNELKQRVAAFIAEHGDLAVEQLDGEEVSMDRIREALESLPFLASQKLVVLRTPSANKDFLAHSESMLSKVPETTTVYIVEPKLDKRSTYYKYLQKNTQYQVYDELDENGLAAWLVRYAKQLNGVISMSDARYLVARAGANQQLVSHELEKLVLYDASITKQSIEALVEATPQSTVFELLDAAFAGKTQRALALYADQRKARVEPQQILAMIAWQLHVFAIVKTAGQRDATTIAKDAKLNPYVVRKSMQAAQSLSVAYIKQLVHAAAQLDLSLKSESIDADDAVQGYIIKLTGRL